MTQLAYIPRWQNLAGVDNRIHQENTEQQKGNVVKKCFTFTLRLVLFFCFPLHRFKSLLIHDIQHNYRNTTNRHRPQSAHRFGSECSQDNNRYVSLFLPIVRGIMPCRGIRLSSSPSRPPYREWEMRRSWSSKEVLMVCWGPRGLPGVSWWWN